MIEKRKLIAGIDISELLKNDNVVNYSQSDSEEAYHEAIAIFQRFCAVTSQYSIIEVTETGLDTYLLLLVYQDFDIDEEILGPNENSIDDQFNELHATPGYWDHVKEKQREWKVEK